VEWLRNVLVNGRDIRVEGTWDSFSTLILLRMPIEVWNLMPEHPAYSFVGFVTSGNLALNHTRSDGETTCDEASNPELTPESEVSAYIGNEWSEASPGRPSVGSNHPGDRELPSPIGRQNVFESTKRISIYDTFHILAHYGNNKKILFICGVFNILLSGYIIGASPELFHYWYTAQLLYLMPIRCYTYHQRGYHFFLPDLCYIVSLEFSKQLKKFRNLARCLLSRLLTNFQGTNPTLNTPSEAVLTRFSGIR
jgi:hypothetical protein